MSTRGAIKIREKGEELRLFYGHDAYPDCLGFKLRRYLNMTSHQWSAMRIFNDLCNGKCLSDGYGGLRADNDFVPTSELGHYEEYGYLIDCDQQKMTCYDLPGIPASGFHPDGNTNDDDWSGREVIEMPSIMVSEEKTSERIKAAVAEYLFGRQKPKPFDACLKVGEHWTVTISVEHADPESF